MEHTRGTGKLLDLEWGLNERSYIGQNACICSERLAVGRTACSAGEQTGQADSYMVGQENRPFSGSHPQMQLVLAK